MGTRNLTCVVSGGEFKVAQYGQWDGYPSGQGLTALNFLRGMDKAIFITKLVDLKFLTEAQCEAINAELRNDGSLMGEGKKYGHLSRDRGADILNIVYDAAPGDIRLVNSINFAADSLFCEWAWVIDLDKNTFEAFKGFNQSGPLPEGERFAFLNDKAERGYYPIKHAHTFSLEALPTDEEFLAVLEPKEDEEEEGGE